MMIMSKLLTGAAGLAMVALVAAPAAAQGYPYGNRAMARAAMSSAR